jgi:Rps23 Pro-64 3,4-dihydroxylase Tpa1-like proline 4-hydroxylase
MIKKHALKNSKDYFVELLIGRITECKKEIINQWQNPCGTKTRHFVIDDLLPIKDVENIYNAFIKNSKTFHRRGSFREKKGTSAKLEQHEKVLTDITYAFQDKKLINLISGLLNLEKIEPDPTLYAGGLSMMFLGDFLNPHIDNSHDMNRSRYRRLNLLFYVSPNWKLKNGGNFELWDKKKLKPHTIVSKQNRLIVMETNRSSWHSVSKIKVNHPRCCVSNYYFSKASPDGKAYFHVTSFSGRPSQYFLLGISFLDNLSRNFIAKIFKAGRGKKFINKKIKSKK